MPGLESGLSAVIVVLFMFWSKEKFVTKKECEKDQGICSSHIGEKIDEVKEGQDKIFEHINKQNVFTGRVLQYMKGNKK